MIAQEIEDLVRSQSEQIAALTKLVARQTALLTPAAPVPELGADMTVGALWVKYAATMSARKWWRGIASLMRPTVAYFSDRVLAEIKPRDWTDYRDKTLSEHLTPSDRHVAPATVNMILVRLKAMANWGVVEEFIAQNPFSGIRPLKAGGRETLIDDSGIERLVACASSLMRALILVAADSGMRVGEIRVLEWSQVDLHTGAVRLPWAKTKSRTARQTRLSDRAIDAINLFPRVARSPWVFCNPNTGKPYSVDRLYQQWRTTVIEAGIQAAPGDRTPHFHDLKASFVSRLSREGTPLFVAMRAAGHTSAHMSWRYTRTTDEDFDEMKARVDRAVKRGPRRQAPTVET